MKPATDPNKTVVFGETTRRDQPLTFGIRNQDRSRHIYVIGQTGTGKSTLLEIMAIQDIKQNDGLVFLDPHGTSVENIINFVEEDRVNDAIYFAPHRTEFPIGLNIMEDIGKDHRHLVASSLISSFHRIWGSDQWSSRMEHILNNTLLALLEYPNTTLLDINRMYSSKEFRTRVVNNISDPQVKSYWVDEFARYSDRYTQDATPAIQNKIGLFTSNPVIRNIVGQTKSAFDFRKIMDEKKMLFVNLSKGLIGDNNARLLGVLFTTKLYLAALSRSDLSASDLNAAPASNFYVDEFQSFANESFASILSEARKYKLNLVMAHQYIGQLDMDSIKTPIRDAVFGNVGTFISFRVGPVDAEIVAKQFAPHFTEEDVIALPQRHMYLTLNIKGAASQPFLAKTVDLPQHPPVSLKERVVEQSDKTYGKSRVEIEERIRLNLSQDWEQGKKDAEKKKDKNKGRQQGGKKPQVQKKEDKPGGEQKEQKSFVQQKDKMVQLLGTGNKQEGGEKVGVEKKEGEKKSALSDLIQSAKGTGLPFAQKVEEKEKPETENKDGWVSLEDLKKSTNTAENEGEEGEKGA